MSFRPHDSLIVCETDHWIINQRVDSALPGYLMLGSRVDTNDLSSLSEAALSELGVHLAKMQRILSELFAPPHFYVGRYGHMAGHSIHFHVIPIYEWVAQRYRVLHEFYTPGVYNSGSDASFDGAEMTLFVWREFCESRNPPEIVGPSIQEAVEMIKVAWHRPCSAGKTQSP
jgi:diadenosine tetraphosphate (Ap4A) HIT family hydrolase